MFRIRFAFVATLAALGVILAACGGGGGAGNMARNGGPNTGGQPAPQPSAGDRSDFFPIPSGHVTHSAGGAGQSLEDAIRHGPLEFEEPTTGATLANLIGEEGTSRNFPQFSTFNFGSATDSNGIPLQKATETQAGRYAAIAYQAVLEHSMVLAQGGIYNYAVGGRTAGYTGGFILVTGDPSTGSAIAGTWRGKAVGFELDVTPRAHTISTAQAESLVVQGDVEIGVTLSGASQNVSFEFDNWAGGSRNYPAVTSRGWEQNPQQASTTHERNLWFPPDISASGLTNGAIRIQFYGPARAEASGQFGFGFGNNYFSGVFGAKKQ